MPKRLTKNRQDQFKRNQARLETLYDLISNDSATDKEVREYVRLLTERIGQEVFLRKREIEQVLKKLRLTEWTGDCADAAVRRALEHVYDGTDWREGFFYDLEEVGLKFSKEGTDKLLADPENQRAKSKVTKGQWLRIWHNFLIDAPLTKSIQRNDPKYTGSRVRRLLLEQLSKYIDLLGKFPQHRQTIYKEIHKWEIGEGKYKASYSAAPISRAACPDDYVCIFQNPQINELLQTSHTSFTETKTKNRKNGRIEIARRIETASFTMSASGKAKLSKLSAPAYRLFVLGLVGLTQQNRTHTKTPTYTVRLSYHEWATTCKYQSTASAEKQLYRAIKELQTLTLNGSFITYDDKNKPTRGYRSMAILGTADIVPSIGYDLTFDPVFVEWIVDTFTMMFPSFRYMELSPDAGALLFFLFQKRQMDETKNRRPVVELFLSVNTLLENFPATAAGAIKEETIKKDPRRALIKPLFDTLDSFSPDIEYYVCDCNKRPLTDPLTGLAVRCWDDIVKSRRRYNHLKNDVVRIQFRRLDGGTPRLT